jgi:hypothetical protein
VLGEAFHPLRVLGSGPALADLSVAANSERLAVHRERVLLLNEVLHDRGRERVSSALRPALGLAAAVLFSETAEQRRQSVTRVGVERQHLPRVGREDDGLAKIIDAPERPVDAEVSQAWFPVSHQVCSDT